MSVSAKGTLYELADTQTGSTLQAALGRLSLLYIITCAVYYYLNVNYPSLLSY